VIAALTMHALLSGFDPRTPATAPATPAHPLMLQLITRLVLPFAVLLSIYFYLRGHNLPGGGFIAGLLLAIAVFLMPVAHGQAWFAAHTPGGRAIDFRSWAGWGLLIAAAAGIGSWALGAPFLTSTYDYPWLPGIGGVPLASASIFDLGVYLVVVGATMVMLNSIARLTSATPQR
jgi:multicomponent K+:H+ antiporter subunit A